MKNPIFTLTIFLLTLFMISACDKTQSLEEIEIAKQNKPGNIAGMGDTNSDLEGTTFHFGEDIDIIGGIMGDDPDNMLNDYCFKTGSGAYVLLQFEFVNKSEKDTVLVLPAGLTFDSNKIQVQNGLLIQSVSIPLAKGQTCKTLVFAYCVNEQRDTPDKTSKFTFGPVNHSDPILELINLLKNKTIDYTHLKEKQNKVALALQTAVWNITEGDGLSKEDREFIIKL